MRVSVFWSPPYIGNADRLGYSLEAHRLLHEAIPPIHHGFVALLTAALRRGVSDERAAQAVSLGFGTPLLPVIWALTPKLFASTAALVMRALNGNLVQASRDGMTDGTFLFFVLAAVLCAAPALQSATHPLLWASCSLLLGIVYTIRVEALVYFAGLAVVIPIIAYFERWPWRRCTYAGLSPTPGFAVVAGAFSAATNVNPLRPSRAPRNGSTSKGLRIRVVWEQTACCIRISTDLGHTVTGVTRAPEEVSSRHSPNYHLGPAGQIVGRNMQVRQLIRAALAGCG